MTRGGDSLHLNMEEIVKRCTSRVENMKRANGSSRFERSTVFQASGFA
jgi:hypothetical protein